jgi:uncharacterized protein
MLKLMTLRSLLLSASVFALFACGASTAESKSKPAAPKPAATAAKSAPAPAPTPASAETPTVITPPEVAARGVKQIGWEDLMPPGEEERLAEMYQARMTSLYSVMEGSAGDTMVQIGTFNTVKELSGKKIRIPGYTVPFDFSEGAQIKEFLLVPYFGACLHSPPPPPNQTLFIKTDKPIKITDLAQAVWIEGTITAETQESDLADAAYTIKMSRIEEYEY